MKTLALVRVSTEKQSCASQREAIERWAVANSCRIDEWIDEGDVSGAAPMEDREKLTALLARVAAKDSDVARLVVCEWSRIGRVADETLHHAMRLHRACVEIVVLDDPYEYDFDDPMDLVRLFLGFAMDHGDRLKTIKRTRRAAVRRPDGSVRTTRKDGTLGNKWGRPGVRLSATQWEGIDALLGQGVPLADIAAQGFTGKQSVDGVDTDVLVKYEALRKMVRRRRRGAAVPA